MKEALISFGVDPFEIHSNHYVIKLPSKEKEPFRVILLFTKAGYEDVYDLLLKYALNGPQDKGVEIFTRTQIEAEKFTEEHLPDLIKYFHETHAGIERGGSDELVLKSFGEGKERKEKIETINNYFDTLWEKKSGDLVLKGVIPSKKNVDNLKKKLNWPVHDKFMDLAKEIKDMEKVTKDLPDKIIVFKEEFRKKLQDFEERLNELKDMHSYIEDLRKKFQDNGSNGEEN